MWQSPEANLGRGCAPERRWVRLGTVAAVAGGGGVLGRRGGGGGASGARRGPLGLWSSPGRGARWGSGSATDRTRRGMDGYGESCGGWRRSNTQSGWVPSHCFNVGMLPLTGAESRTYVGPASPPLPHTVTESRNEGGTPPPAKRWGLCSVRRGRPGTRGRGDCLRRRRRRMTRGWSPGSADCADGGGGNRPTGSQRYGCRGVEGWLLRPH